MGSLIVTFIFAFLLGDYIGTQRAKVKVLKWLLERNEKGETNDEQ